MFNSSLSINISDSQNWKNLQSIQSDVIGSGLLFSLLLIWGDGFLHSRHGKKH
jgi:hypothetical protein